MLNQTCPLVTDNSELEHFLKENHRVVALLFARWCPFCMQFLPVFQRYAQDQPGNFLLIQDDQEHFAYRFDVDIIPTVLYFEEGKIERRLDGIPGMGLSETLFFKFIETCPDL